MVPGRIGVQLPGRSCVHRSRPCSGELSPLEGPESLSQSPTKSDFQTFSNLFQKCFGSIISAAVKKISLPSIRSTMIGHSTSILCNYLFENDWFFFRS